MDAKFLEFYNQELKFIREMAAEFAKEYPKIAGRLGLDGFDCSDPYIERLLEGFAFLSARIHLKLDASFPKFTQHLMELLFPTFQYPSPSMLIAQFSPDVDAGNLANGAAIAKETPLHSLLGKGEQTACEYKTVHDVTLWPIEVTDAEYLNAREVLSYTAKLKLSSTPKSGILLTLKTMAGHTFSELSLDKLSFYLRGSESLPFHLFEALYKGFQGLLYKAGNQLWRYQQSECAVRAHGYSSEQAMLPYSNLQFDGFRLLREYFLFQHRFLFLSIDNLNTTLLQCDNDEIQLLLLLEHHDARLDNLVSADNFALHCTPAINLFAKRAERINVSRASDSFHVVPDRIRSLDYEVCAITSVKGLNTGIDQTSQFLPLYSSPESAANVDSGALAGATQHSKKYAYYTVSREPRSLTEKQKKFGHRSSYIGSETYVSLVDSAQAPYSDNLRQLAIETLCSNRDLPLMMPLGKGNTDFTIETGAPCKSVRCLGEPTRPQAPLAQGRVTWDLINVLAINFIGIDEASGQSTLAQIKMLLTLMMDKNDLSQIKQVDGIVKADVSRITRRLPFDGPMCFGRGVEVKLTVDELAYEGSSVFLLGMVLDQFFAQYVSINSFTQLVIISTNKGEIFRWPVRIGLRHPI